MSKPGRVTNLYYPADEKEIHDTVVRLAQIKGISVSEMYIDLIAKGLAVLKKQYPDVFKEVKVEKVNQKE